MKDHGNYVQYGCGLCAPNSWINFDASPTLRVQRIPLVGKLVTRGGPRFPVNVQYGDIVRGLPVPPGSCAAVYCSHVLEHLSLGDLRISLRNTFELLQPGGVFRFVLPDLEQLARQYAASTAKQPAIEFMESTLLGYQQRPRGLRGFIREWLGNSRHLWMWDARSLTVELLQVGFTDVRRVGFGNSADPRFREVEEAGRWKDCLGMECRKP